MNETMTEKTKTEVKVIRYENLKQDKAARTWLYKQAIDMTKAAIRPVQVPVTGEAKTVAIEKAIANTKGICSDGRDDVANILSVVLGIPKLEWRKHRRDDSTGAYKTKRYTVMIPLKNENGHDYPLGEPVMIHSNGYDQGFVTNGRTGAHLDLHASDDVLRLATPKEIKKFVDNCDIKKIFSALSIQPMFM